MRAALPWALLSAACALALVRALAAKGPAPPPPGDEALKKKLYDVIASEEPENRRAAAKDFPTDLWSQDDDYHSMETQRAMGLAREKRVPISFVLSALDEGMREQWPRRVRVPVQATVPPCQPRAIY